MGYLHVNNLYKDQTILMLKECYAMEKIHGTSANIGFVPSEDKKSVDVKFFSGGEKYELFCSLFDVETLKEKFYSHFGRENIKAVCVYGEAYGGKQQGMKDTYGDKNKFISFEVKIEDKWLSVPRAEIVALNLGLEFVHYKKISTNLEDIDRERDADSIQAIRNGMGPGKKREGVVLRPLEELTLNNGARIISKHKRDDFRETRTPRPVDKERLVILQKAEEIANEWVTDMRLQHILQKFPEDVGLDKTGEIIRAMVEDVLREAAGEIVESQDTTKAISRKTALMFKELVKSRLRNAI